MTREASGELPNIRDVVIYDGEEYRVIGTNSLNNTVTLQSENRLCLNIEVSELDRGGDGSEERY